MSSAPGSRDKILVCARDLFYFVGYQTTSVDDILRVCGVAKSNFYYHFRTKDELALAVLRMQIADFEAGAIATLSDRRLGPFERFALFCETLARAQAEVLDMGGCPFGNFAAGLCSRNEDDRTRRFRELLGGFFNQTQSALEGCFADGIQSGAFRSDLPADRLAAMTLAAMEGLMLVTKTRRDTTQLRQGLLVLQQLLRVH